MAVFMLDTDLLQGVSATFETLKSHVSDLVSSAEQYDVSCDDDFDFGSAKSAIINNLDACAIKIMNTAYVLKNVCDSHIELQQSLEFNAPYKFEAPESSDSSSNTSSYYNNSKESNYGDIPSEDGTSTVITNMSNSVGGSVNANANIPTEPTSIAPTPVETNSNVTSSGKVLNTEGYAVAGVAGAAGAAAGFKPEAEDNKEKSKRESTRSTSNDKLKSYSKSTIDKKNIVKVEMATVLERKLDSDSVNFFMSNKVKSDGGLMVSNNKYVVSCDKSIGKVGDIIKFRQSDGTEVDCVVGIVTSESKNKNVVNFLVTNKDSITSENRKLCSSVLNNSSTIEKYAVI